VYATGALRWRDSRQRGGRNSSSGCTRFRWRKRIVIIEPLPAQGGPKQGIGRRVFDPDARWHSGIALVLKREPIRIELAPLVQRHRDPEPLLVEFARPLMGHGDPRQEFGRFRPSGFDRRNELLTDPRRPREIELGEARVLPRYPYCLAVDHRGRAARILSGLLGNGVVIVSFSLLLEPPLLCPFAVRGESFFG
jgi:hypothetical protein